MRPGDKPYTEPGSAGFQSDGSYVPPWEAEGITREAYIAKHGHEFPEPKMRHEGECATCRGDGWLTLDDAMAGDMEVLPVGDRMRCPNCRPVRRWLAEHAPSRWPSWSEWLALAILVVVLVAIGREVAS
jgi:hypothetical protein